MKIKSIVSTTLALIASVNLFTVSATASPSNTLFPQELDPCKIADYMGNETPNAFCDFRIVTNAKTNNVTEVVIGDDIFLFDNSETEISYVLFNTRGTADVTDDIIIGIYESPSPIDDSAELALYEQLYNDMWNLR